MTKWQILKLQSTKMLAIIIIIVIVVVIALIVNHYKEEQQQEQYRQEERIRIEAYEQEELRRREELLKREALRRQEEQRRQEEEQHKQEEAEKLLAVKLAKSGARYQYVDNKMCVEVLEDGEIQEVLYYGRELNSIKRNNHSITYELLDNERNIVASVLYEEIFTKGKHCFTCTIRFVEDSSIVVINKDFFSDCCKVVKYQLFCYTQNRKIKLAEKTWDSILKKGMEDIKDISLKDTDIENRILNILNQSDYKSLFVKDIDIAYSNSSVIINYKLPNKEDFLKIKEYKFVAKSNEVVEKLYSESFISQLYEKALYSICLRSIYEVFYSTDAESLYNVTFNGYINHINRSVGKEENKYILSLYATRAQFENIELKEVEPKLCFKSLKGVSATKLADVVAITPIITFDKKDRRFIESKNVCVNEGTNLAIMEWIEFEQLVRELFELEFSKVGGEVKVTQASRDGGVDAIIYDPDPIRGGKIVVQAKRYTNTVSVAAVRDLYGTVINEGANSGILITTSDYGNDSYEFAKNKPLKLLNGGHLLGLLEKHGKQAYINIKEAKDIISSN